MAPCNVSPIYHQTLECEVDFERPLLQKSVESFVILRVDWMGDLQQSRYAEDQVMAERCFVISFLRDEMTSLLFC